VSGFHVMRPVATSTPSDVVIGTYGVAESTYPVARSIT
jgi:hypothetical protein